MATAALRAAIEAFAILTSFRHHAKYVASVPYDRALNELWSAVDSSEQRSIVTLLVSPPCAVQKLCRNVTSDAMHTHAVTVSA